MNDEWWREDEASTSLHNAFAWLQIEILEMDIIHVYGMISTWGSDSTN